MARNPRKTQIMNIFLRPLEFIVWHFYTRDERGQWTPGGIVGAVLILLLVLVLLRAFGLI